ncbi:MAG TPA: universal stress protein, partial [Coleofasciculaceae cyanobacterium]
GSGQSPAETAIDPATITPMRKLFERTTRAGRAWQIPVHSQICLACDPAEAILEVIQRRRIDLVVMGWQGTIARPGAHIFGDSLARVLRDAPCEVMLVKWGDGLFTPKTRHHQDAVQAMLSLDRWLVPIGGGPNVERALNLLPPLLSLTRSAAVTLCQVLPASADRPDADPQPWTTEVLDQATARLDRAIDTPVTAVAFCAPNITEAILRLALRLDSQVIVLGASRESLLKQVIHGNLPAAIARHYTGTILVVRGPLDTD